MFKDDFSFCRQCSSFFDRIIRKVDCPNCTNCSLEVTFGMSEVERKEIRKICSQKIDNKTIVNVCKMKDLLSAIKTEVFRIHPSMDPDYSINIEELLSHLPWSFGGNGEYDVKADMTLVSATKFSRYLEGFFQGEYYDDDDKNRFDAIVRRVIEHILYHIRWVDLES